MTIDPRARLSLMLVGCLAAVAACSVTSMGEDQPLSAQIPGKKVFQGAWFEISYPPGFTPAPSLSSPTADGFDSAEFISPDGSVSFYVYAPQWGGEPTDIAMQPAIESMVSTKRTEQNGRVIKWLTICAKDGSYCRAYQDTTAEQGSLRTILGIKYRDEAARRQYHKEYLQFRKSLEQFAD